MCSDTCDSNNVNEDCSSPMCSTPGFTCQGNICLKLCELTGTCIIYMFNLLVKFS